MVYVIFLAIALPLALLLPLLDGHARPLILFLLLGMGTALVCWELDSLLYPLTGLDAFSFTITVTPMVEETGKAVPVLLFALLCNSRRESLLPAAMSAGIGFALLETTAVIAQNPAAVTLGWAALRGLASSLMHGLCTMAVGAGMVYVRSHKKLFYTGTFGLLALAITLHALFNLLLQSDYLPLAAVLPLVLYALVYLAQRIGLRLPFLSY